MLYVVLVTKKLGYLSEPYCFECPKAAKEFITDTVVTNGWRYSIVGGAEMKLQEL